MDEVSGYAAAIADVRQSDTNNYVSFAQSETLGTGFAEAMDSVRGRASAMDAIANDLREKGADGSTGGRQVAQLVDLYSYAVDTQLLVRTGSQLTTGIRQLISGQ